MKHEMTLRTAIEILIDMASRYGENTEEGFCRRVKASDGDADCAQIFAKSENGYAINDIIEIRDLWRAIEVAHDFVKPRF